MVRRRRNTGKQSGRKAAPKRSSKKSGSNQSLKERVLTTAIWGLSLLNVALIFSLVSNFFASPNEVAVSANSRVAEQSAPAAEERVTVEVLNACGVNGLANEVTQYLRDNNFDVVNVGNYSTYNLDRTLVFDRVSMSSKYAKRVASVLNVQESQVVPELEDSMQLMVTVIIGKDYKDLRLFAAKR